MACLKDRRKRPCGRCHLYRGRFRRDPRDPPDQRIWRPLRRRAHPRLDPTTGQQPQRPQIDVLIISPPSRGGRVSLLVVRRRSAAVCGRGPVAGPMLQRRRRLFQGEDGRDGRVQLARLQLGPEFVPVGHERRPDPARERRARKGAGCPRSRRRRTSKSGFGSRLRDRDQAARALKADDQVEEGGADDGAVQGVLVWRPRASGAAPGAPVITCLLYLTQHRCIWSFVSRSLLRVIPRLPYCQSVDQRDWHTSQAVACCS